MPLPLRDYVQQVFMERDRAPKVYSAVHRGWNAAMEAYPERGRWVRKSTFRTLIWEAVVRELEKISHEDDDFKAVFHRDTASFIIEDAILFRFKHADNTLATSNYPTSEAVAFDDHEVDLWGLKGLQRIELCYVLDELETAVAWVGLSARSHGKFLWKIELSSEGIQQSLEPSFFDDDVDATKIVQIKRPDQDQNKDKKDRG
ncbi:hypothetical protein [Neorhizobium vignae]|uniref:hypothetical protein n=1 Tax=Neorhizobium vignae TaxID=690585 RepID=UPI000563B05F|nr:hypothetical protein [Neorhizobium vignae]